MWTDNTKENKKGSSRPVVGIREGRNLARTPDYITSTPKSDHFS